MADAARVALRGTCSVCDREIAITKEGNVRHHGAKSKAWPPVNCVGSGKPPTGEQASDVQDLEG